MGRVWARLSTLQPNRVSFYSPTVLPHSAPGTPEDDCQAAHGASWSAATYVLAARGLLVCDPGCARETAAQWWGEAHSDRVLVGVHNRRRTA